METIVDTRTAELKKANKKLVSAYEQLKVHDKTPACGCKYFQYVTI